MSRTYYAAQYPYGIASDANSGRLIRTIHTFPTRAERDAWVADRSTDCRGNSGYRQALQAREITHHERGADDGWHLGWVEHPTEWELAEAGAR